MSDQSMAPAVMELNRLVRISEAVHAVANKWEGSTTYLTAVWLLSEAKCDCEQCKKRRTESG